MTKLGKELWKKIETPQGRAFISDGVEGMPDEQVLEVARVALDWQIEGVKVLRAFLKAHLTPRALDGAKAPQKTKAGRKSPRK